MSEGNVFFPGSPEDAHIEEAPTVVEQTEELEAVEDATEVAIDEVCKEEGEMNCNCNCNCEQSKPLVPVALEVNSCLFITINLANATIAKLAGAEADKLKSMTINNRHTGLDEQWNLHNPFATSNTKRGTPSGVLRHILAGVSNIIDRFNRKNILYVGDVQSVQAVFNSLTTELSGAVYDAMPFDGSDLELAVREAGGDDAGIVVDFNDLFEIRMWPFVEQADGVIRATVYFNIIVAPMAAYLDTPAKFIMRAKDVVSNVLKSVGLKLNPYIAVALDSKSIIESGEMLDTVNLLLSAEEGQEFEEDAGHSWSNITYREVLGGKIDWVCDPSDVFPAESDIMLFTECNFGQE